MSHIVELIETQHQKVESDIKDHEGRVRTLEDAQARMSERISLWQTGQAVYTTIASIVASVVGRTP